MTQICGILCTDAAAPAAASLSGMVDVLDDYQPDSIRVWHGEGVGLGQLTHATVPGASGGDLLLENARYVLVADARIDNREALNMHFQFTHLQSDGAYILAAFEKWQMSCCEKLHGDYAFAIYDKQSRQLFLGRDIFGIRPLFYFHDHQIFAFSSEIKGLLALPEVKKRIHEAWLFDLMTHGVLMTKHYSDKTAYQDIYELPPAHYLCTGNQRINRFCYWQLAPDPALTISDFHECADALSFELSRAVRVRVRPDENIGCELSGGLDSSGVAAYAADVSSELKAFTHVPMAGGEWPYADAVAQHLGLHMHRAISGKGYCLESMIERYLNRCDEPSSVLFPLLNMPLQDAAVESGCRVILSGFGGDECVSQSGRHCLGEAARVGSYRLFAAALNASTLRTWMTFLKYLIRYRYPRCYERLTDCRRSRRIPLSAFKISQHFKQYVDSQVKMESFEALDLGRSNLEQSLILLNGRLRWHISERVRYTALTEKRLVYRYPMLDRTLLTFAISQPSHFKFQRGVTRYLFRQAISDKLPEKIVCRRDKSGRPAAGMFESVIAQLDNRGESPGSRFEKQYWPDKPVIDMMVNAFIDQVGARFDQ